MEKPEEKPKSFIPQGIKELGKENVARQMEFQKKIVETGLAQEQPRVKETPEEIEKKKQSLFAKLKGMFVKSEAELKEKGLREINKNKFKKEAYQNLLTKDPEKAEKYLIAAGKYQTIKWSEKENNYVDASSYHYS